MNVALRISDEQKYLRILSEYATHPNVNQLAKELQLWPATIRNIANAANIYRKDPRSWSIKQVNIVHNEYMDCEDLGALAAKIGKTKMAVRAKAASMGMRKSFKRTEPQLTINHAPVREFTKRDRSWNRPETFPKMTDVNIYQYHQ